MNEFEIIQNKNKLTNLTNNFSIICRLDLIDRICNGSFTNFKIQNQNIIKFCRKCVNFLTDKIKQYSNEELNYYKTYSQNLKILKKESSNLTIELQESIREEMIKSYSKFIKLEQLYLFLISCKLSQKDCILCDHNFN